MTEHEGLHTDFIISINEMGTLLDLVLVSVIRREATGGSVVKNQPAMQETQETQVQSLGREDPLEVGMATHFSMFAWKIPWT